MQQGGGNAGDAPEVAVDLEGRVVVEQVGQGGFPQQQLDVLPRLFPVLQRGPEVDNPGAAPAGVTAPVGKAALQGLAGGLGQLWGALGGDLVAGMEGEQVGHVPVAHLHLLVLLQPLLQGAVGGHLRLGQVFQDFLELGGQLLLAAQQLTGGDAAPEQLCQNLAVHGAALAQAGHGAAGMDIAVLRGEGGRNHPAALGVPDEGVHKEQAGVPQQVEVLPEELLIQGVLVPLPDVGAHPGGAHHPIGGGDAAVLGRAVPPQIRVVVGHKAPGAVHLLGHLLATGVHALQQIEEGQVALGEVAHLHRPVVHLRVDIDGVLAVPGRLKLAVPHALEVGGQRARPAGGDGQVAAKGEVQGHQPQVLLPVLDAGQARIGGQGLQGAVRCQGEAGAVVQSLVVLEVGLPQLPLRQGRGVQHPAALLHRVLHAVGGGGCPGEGRLVGVFHHQVLPHHLHGAAHGGGPQHGAKPDALAAGVVDGVLLLILEGAVGIAAPVHAHLEADPALAAAAQAHHHHVVRGADVGFPGVVHAAAGVGHSAQGVVQIQLAGVVLHLPCLVFHGQVDVPQSLVHPLKLRGAGHGQGGQVLGLGDVALPQQPADFRQVVFAVRVHPVAEPPRPHAVLVELDALGHRAAKHHSTQLAIAQGKGAVPVLRRALIPQTHGNYSSQMLNIKAPRRPFQPGAPGSFGPSPSYHTLGAASNSFCETFYWL